jgi:glutathione S-transferase
MLELVVFENCPFCHRCMLVLAEKGASFNTLRLERSKKPASKQLLSPYLRAPVLWHDGRPVYESSIINEYLEEILPTPSLLPKDPAQRALARFWIDFCNTRFMPGYFNLLKERNRELRAPLREALADHLRFIDTIALAHLSEASPYWMGQDVTLVDYAFYPFFERFVSVEVYRDMAIPADLRHVHGWLKMMQEREAVQRLARSREHYVEYFGRIYADPESRSRTRGLPDLDRLND